MWTTDDSKALDDSILRRFVFHLKLHQRPLSARRQLLSQVIPDFVVDPGKLDAIAAQHSLSPAQLTMAARFARLAAKDKPASRTKALLCAVDASQRITDRTPTGLLQSADGSHWDLETLNLEASAPLPRILDGLRRTGCASMVFHGIPGTGKSSLAAYIANTLDRPLLTKRVSDLSSRWIGDTEKAIANMFREAAADGSVLLLDEADSFLRDRRLARSPWEVTQVNELLQQMENFKGVFICATNLIRTIDEAALRRFTFKIKFLPLDDVRRRRMLAIFALSDANAELPQPIGERLSALSQLAPGDFATVRRQEVLIDERFSLESWIAELEREHAARVPTAKRRAAFV
ncbi:MAG: ATP-binding protein [Proteobacteria bacterium]|nr:ATP-binding protein [Pseudomonadota bacterium]